MGQGLGPSLVSLTVLVRVGGRVISSYPKAEFSWVSTGASGVMWIQVWLCSQACAPAGAPPPPPPPASRRRAR